MIEHLVLLKFKPGTDRAAIERLHAGLAGLRTLVPGVVDLTVGANFSTRNQGYDTGLVVRFRDRAALDVYIKHPAHVEVVEASVKPILASLIAVDYEF